MQTTPMVLVLVAAQWVVRTPVCHYGVTNVPDVIEKVLEEPAMVKTVLVLRLLRRRRRVELGNAYEWSDYCFCESGAL